jgi:hypothetical protein
MATHFRRKQYKRWLWKTSWNLFYVLARPGHNVRILRHARAERMTLAPSETGKMTVVTSRHDPWARELPPDEMRKHPQRRYVSLTGAHDDLWTNPAILCRLIEAVHEA